MSITASPTVSSSEPPPPQPSPLPRWIYVAFLILLGGIGYLAYAGYTARQQFNADLTKSQENAAQLSTRLDQANGRIAEMRGQLEVTSGKIGLTQAEVSRAQSRALQIEKEQKDSDAQLNAKIGQVKQETDAKIGAVSTDLSGTKTDLDATKKDLDATKSKLTMATGDINNQGTLIAKNHDEVEELKRLNERNIYDFTLTTKTKGPQKVGPIQLQLTKVDSKKYKYTVIMVVDDKQIEKKDKTVDELWQITTRGSRAPYDVVVFEVGKDRITGYLSTPKDSSGAPPAAKPTS
jgi:predicted  nucleic acid-binding Zn-ribbon protein